MRFAKPNFEHDPAVSSTGGLWAKIVPVVAFIGFLSCTSKQESRPEGSSRQRATEKPETSGDAQAPGDAAFRPNPEEAKARSPAWSKADYDAIVSACIDKSSDNSPGDNETYCRCSSNVLTHHYTREALVTTGVTKSLVSLKRDGSFHACIEAAMKEGSANGLAGNWSDQHVDYMQIDCEKKKQADGKKSGAASSSEDVQEYCECAAGRVSKRMRFAEVLWMSEEKDEKLLDSFAKAVEPCKD